MIVVIQNKYDTVSYQHKKRTSKKYIEVQILLALKCKRLGIWTFAQKMTSFCLLEELLVL